jgi:benzoyl-CoA reductase/2-hydroxyglutaryl-CoA dehydratase subunit BcrC/BadD/HgdB
MASRRAQLQRHDQSQDQDGVHPRIPNKMAAAPMHQFAPRPNVGLFSAYLPRELFYAQGCLPIRVFPTATKPTAAEAYLPRNFCGLIRLLLASFIEDGRPQLDGVVFADEDDATRRLCDVWQACVSVPVWGFVEVPRNVTPLAIDRYAALLSRLVPLLEVQTGQLLDPDSLRQAIQLFNQQRVLLAALKQSWLDGAISTLTYRRQRRMALTQEPLSANQALEQTLRDLVEQREREDGPRSEPTAPPRLRLLLSAELAAPTDLVRLIEARNGTLVAEESDLDERDLAEPIPLETVEADDAEGLLITLASAYLSKPPGPRMRDLPGRLDHITGLVAQRGVMAAIFAYNKFCDLYLGEFPTLKAHLEGLGVPVLLLEMEDDALSGQHRTRVEAFLEMLRGDMPGAALDA